MIETLTITNVNTKRLEEQRHTLAYIADNLELFPHLDPHRQEHIVALSNMLNEWSDEQYHALKEKDACPQCGGELMFGPNGSTVCSVNGCPYWRE